jgi:PncC family amidohydrolase
MSDALVRAAEQLAEQLRRSGLRVVFAESCTAGLVTATLARIPGISEHVCGSAVVYRNATKTAWLGVSAEALADESTGPVSEQVAAAMARGVLARTPEADMAVSVTGHLGPDAPAHLDGVIYVGIARRDTRGGEVRIERVLRKTLAAEFEPSSEMPSLRLLRQQEAAAFVLHSAVSAIDAASGPT